MQEKAEEELRKYLLLLLSSSQRMPQRQGWKQNRGKPASK